MKLVKLLKKENIFIANHYKNTDSFYHDYSLFLKNNNIINDDKKVRLLFIKRENVQSTAIGKGAATPHIFSNEFSQFTFSIAFIKKGIDFKAPDKKKVYLIFLIMSDDRDVGLHLKALAHIARLVSNTNIVEATKNVESPESLIQIITQKDQLI